jgi:hypothetical protein
LSCSVLEKFSIILAVISPSAIRSLSVNVDDYYPIIARKATCLPGKGDLKVC